jgi:hypothetical protein
MGASTMTVDVTWMRCLDKRDHVIPRGPKYWAPGVLRQCVTRGSTP